MEMDVRQRGTGQDEEYQANQAPGEQPAAPFPRLVALTEDLVGLYRQQQREDIGKVTEHHEQDIGAVGASGAAEVLNIVDLAVMAPARIVLAIGQQGHHQEQAQRSDGDQCTFLEAVVQVLAPEWNNCFGCCGGFLQNLLFLRQWRVHLLNDYKTAQSRQVKKLTGVTGSTFNTAHRFS
ncbi:hypothetical protein D3C76_742480 [compost metagenome]